MVESHSEVKSIGGYFELADREAEHSLPIKGGVLLNTGRNALEYILLSIPDVKKVYLPYYTCEVVLEPFKRNHIIYNFYHINARFEIADDINLNDGEYLIANNYFGLKDYYITVLAEKYGERLIVDNAQALYAPVLPGIKAFYSARKFVGVADGGIAVGVDGKYSLYYEEDDSTLHNSHLLIRKEQGAEVGFHDYQENEKKLDNQSIRRMCTNTRDILFHIDYEKVKEKRRSNFEYLHQTLKECNNLQVPSLDIFSCPMVYPLLLGSDRNLRSELIKNKVFVARYWPNVLNWRPNDSIEYLFADKIIPLPVDQRCDEEDLSRIVKIIKS